MVRRQTEHAVARLDSAILRVNRFDDADHFVARLADGCGIAVVGQVMYVANIAAAEGQTQRLDERSARLHGRFGGIDKGGLSAGDDLHSFHWLISPVDGSRLALSIAVSLPAVYD